MKVADVGDVDICMYDITKAADRITEYYKVWMDVLQNENIKNGVTSLYFFHWKGYMIL